MMEEAMTDIASIPEINEFEGFNSRRYSTGNVSVRNVGVTVINSRYLKASQGSCHDICKYGTRSNLETESRNPRIPLPKIVSSIRANSRQTLERTESNPVVIKIGQRQGGHNVDNAELKLTDRKKSDTKPQKPDNHVVSLRPSSDLVDSIKTTATEGEAQDEENAETKLAKGEKKSDVSLKPVDTDCYGREVSLTLKETDVAAAHARDLKLKPQSKPSQECSSGKQKIEGRKSKGTNVMSMTSLGISSGTNKGEIMLSEAMRTSVAGQKKNVSIVNVKKQKSSRVYRVKQENSKKIEPGKSFGKDVKGCSNEENAGKPNSEQANSADIPEKTLYIVEINPENKPAEESTQSSVHVSDLSTKEKSMNQTSNRTAMGQSPRSFSSEKKNIKYRPKGIHSIHATGKKGLRSTPYVSSSSLASSKFSHSDPSSGHDAVAATKQRSSSKMMYKGRPKWALVTTFKNKHLQGGKLNSQRGKVVEVPLEDCSPGRLVFRQRVLVDNDDSEKGKIEECTPRRLKFRQRVVVDNRNGDNQNGKGEDITPRRLKYRRRVVADNQNGRGEENTPRRLKFKPRVVVVDNKNADHQNGRSEDMTPRRLNFRRRVVVDNRMSDNQNVRSEENTPRRLKFKQRVVVDNRNADNQNGKSEDMTPRRLNFRRRVVVDDRMSDNQNGSSEENTPRRLKFRKRVAVDNRNADNSNGSGEDITPRKLKSWRRVLDDNENGGIQKSEGDTSKKEAEEKEPEVGEDNATEVQPEKASLRHNDVEEKKDSGLYNNMIEETATRLVRSRSSKVKALVSAFESVISLLDTNNIN